MGEYGSARLTEPRAHRGQSVVGVGTRDAKVYPLVRAGRRERDDERVDPGPHGQETVDEPHGSARHKTDQERYRDGNGERDHQARREDRGESTKGADRDVEAAGGYDYELRQSDQAGYRDVVDQY